MIPETLIKLEQAALAAQAEHQYDSAINLHAEAITETEGLDRPRLRAVLFNRLGWALEVDGQVQKAVVAYEIGFQFLAGGQHDLQRVVDRLRTVSKEFSGERQLALDALFSPDTAQDLTEAEADPVLAVKLLINIGNAYLLQPQEYPALNAYQRAVERPEISQTPLLHAHALTHIGIIRRRLGNLTEAEIVLRQALTLFQQHSDDPTAQRTTLAALASLYRDQGDLAKALATYHQALDLYAQVEDPRGTARTQIGLGRLYLKQADVELAEQNFKAALALAEGVHDHEAQWHALAGLARIQEQRDDLEGAAALLRQSLRLIEARQDELRTDQGKASFIDSLTEIFDQLIAVHLKRAEHEPAAYAEALNVAETARAQALLDLMDFRGRRTHQTKPGETSGSVSLAPGTPSDPEDDFNPVAQMAVHNPIKTVENTSRLAPSTRSQGRAEQPEDGAALQLPPLPRLVFHVLPTQTAIFAVTPEGAVHGHVAEIGEVELAAQVSAMRRMLGVDRGLRGVRDAAVEVDETEAGEVTDHQPLLKKLYETLIAPLAGTLPPEGSPLVIEPHGPLWLLPFAALLAADDIWLADQWPLLYTPSAQVLDEIRQEPDYGAPVGLKALIVGNPTMPSITLAGSSLELLPLAGAEAEAKAIAALFKEDQCQLLVSDAADRLTVTLEAPQRGILHLATHGLADAADPLASFVVLAKPRDGDGLLTARQVMDLRLQTDLVTLSACQTGLGKISGDGMIGLSRAFVVAGARSVLVSQWSVSDEATVALMKAFYREYLRQDNKALALQQAMQEVRANPEFSHPRYWAPFVVVGAEA